MVKLFKSFKSFRIFSHSLGFLPSIYILSKGFSQAIHQLLSKCPKLFSKYFFVPYFEINKKFPIEIFAK